MDSTRQIKRSMWSRIKRYLLAGIVVTAPAFITLYTTIALVNLADRWVKSLIPARFYPDVRILGIPGIGLVFLLILLVVIGFLTASWLGNILIGIADRFFSNTPVLSSLYSTLKQLFHTFLGDNTNAFRRVVLVEFPRDGCWSIGFVTGTFPMQMENAAEEMLYVFVPTTPNPTNGFLVVLPQSKVRDSNMTVEQGLKAVVSMGITR